MRALSHPSDSSSSSNCEASALKLDRAFLGRSYRATAGETLLRMDPVLRVVNALLEVFGFAIASEAGRKVTRRRENYKVLSRLAASTAATEQRNENKGEGVKADRIEYTNKRSTFFVRCLRILQVRAMTALDEHRKNLS